MDPCGGGGKGEWGESPFELVPAPRAVVDMVRRGKEGGGRGVGTRPSLTPVTLDPRSTAWASWRRWSSTGATLCFRRRSGRVCRASRGLRRHGTTPLRRTTFPGFRDTRAARGRRKALETRKARAGRAARAGRVALAGRTALARRQQRREEGAGLCLHHVIVAPPRRRRRHGAGQFRRRGRPRGWLLSLGPDEDAPSLLFPQRRAPLPARRRRRGRTGAICGNCPSAKSSTSSGGGSATPSH